MGRKMQGKRNAWGCWVLGIRRAAGYKSAESFAEMIGKSRGTVADWERGANVPDSESLLKLMSMFPGAPPPPNAAGGAHRMAHAAVPRVEQAPEGMVPQLTTGKSQDLVDAAARLVAREMAKLDEDGQLDALAALTEFARAGFRVPEAKQQPEALRPSRQGRPSQQ